MEGELCIEQRCLQVFEGKKAFALKPHNSSFSYRLNLPGLLRKSTLRAQAGCSQLILAQGASGAEEGHKELDGRFSPQFGKDGIHLWTVWERDSGRDLGGCSFSPLPEATQPSVSLYDFSLYHSTGV